MNEKRRRTLLRTAQALEASCEELAKPDARGIGYMHLSLLHDLSTLVRAVVEELQPEGAGDAG
jgi:hypothetical protein